MKLPVAGFAGAMGLAYLYLLFYLTLAMMLATLFSGRGPVFGIAAGRCLGLDAGATRMAGGALTLETAHGCTLRKAHDLTSLVYPWVGI